MQEIRHFSKDVLAVVLYSPSEGVEAKALSLMRERLDVAAEFMLRVADEKELTRALSSVVIYPLLGKRWMLIVDADKISPRVLPTYMNKILYNSCVVVYRTARYGTFKRLQEEKVRKQFGPLFPAVDCGRFFVDDVKLLAKMYDVTLTDEWLKFYTKQYGTEPDSLNTLFQMIHAGYQIIDKQSVIAAVGLGKTSTAEFILKVLQLKPMTPRGIRISQRGVMQYLRDLAIRLDYVTLQNYLMDTLDGFIDIKLSYILGYITAYKQKDPKFITEEKRKNRYNRLLRYRKMLQEIPLERMLLYRSLYTPIGRDEASVKLSLVRWLMVIYGSLGIQNGQEPREQRVDIKVPLEPQFKLSDVTDYEVQHEKLTGEKKKRTSTVKKTKKTAAQLMAKAPVIGATDKAAEKPKADTFTELFKQAGDVTVELDGGDTHA